MLIKSTLLLESSYQKCKFNLTQTVKSQGSSPKIKKIARWIAWLQTIAPKNKNLILRPL